MLSRYCMISKLSFSQQPTLSHLDLIGQLLPCFRHGAKQGRSPVACKICATVQLLAETANLYPPAAPRALSTSFALISIEMIFSRYLTDMFWFSLNSATETNSFDLFAKLAIILTAYLPFDEIFIFASYSTKMVWFEYTPKILACQWFLNQLLKFCF